MEYRALSNGLKIPIVGLGTWQITDRHTLSDVISNAYKYGYSFIDTAAAYSNELSIGRTIQNLDIQRKNLFISSKVWNTNRGYEQVQLACQSSLKKLKTDYLDAYLVHWPASPKMHKDWEELNAETWRGMEQLYKDGIVRSIGVCNFKIKHLEALLKNVTIAPMILQIEYHPGMNTQELIELNDRCKEIGIVLEASSPLGNGQILKNEKILEVAGSHKKSAAQICLRYCIQKDFIVIPKSINQSRLHQNIDIFDFQLSKEEMTILDNLPFCGGLNLDPDEVTQFE